MKTYSVTVAQLWINSQRIQIKHITLTIDDKVVKISEFPEVKYRCSRLKFYDVVGYPDMQRLQTDGLKVIFNNREENWYLFRSHVEQVCGTTSEITQKKRKSSNTFDCVRSPVVDRRRPGAMDSPALSNKYQRQIVSSVKKDASPALRASRAPPANAASNTGNRPAVKKTHQGLLGSPAPKNKKKRAELLGESRSQDTPLNILSQEFSLSQSQQKSDTQPTRARLRTSASPHKTLHNDVKWARLFAKQKCEPKNTVLSPQQLPAYGAGLSLSQAKTISPADVNSAAKIAYETPPPSKKTTSYSASPVDLFLDDSDNIGHGNGALMGAFAAAASRPVQNFGGIKNLGNTCFIGGVLQAMFCLEPFKNDLVSKFWTSVIEESSHRYNTACVSELSKFLLEDNTPRKTPLNVNRFKDTITSSLGKYQGYVQHDAHEFLCDLLNLVEEDLTKSIDGVLSKHNLMLSNTFTTTKACPTETGDLDVSRSVNVAQDLFRTPTVSTAVVRNITAKDKNAVGNRPVRKPEGEQDSASTENSVISSLNPATRNFSSTVDSTLTCTNCNEQRVLKEKYKDFALEIGTTSDASVSLEQMFSSFFAKETRELQCEHCNHSEAKVDVSTSISKLPPVLCVQLKRFCYNSTLQQHEKISKRVSFPSLLNMKDYCALSDCPDDCIPASILNQSYHELLAGPFVETRKGKLVSPSSSAATPNMSIASPENGKVTTPPVSPPSSLSWTCEMCTFNNNVQENHVPLNLDGTEKMQSCEMCNADRYTVDNDDIDVDDKLSNEENYLASTDAANIPFMYELVAVLRHVGAHSSAGHYTCDVKKRKAGATQKTWQHCDDSVITPISQKAVLEKQEDPYILFYQRC